MCVLSVKTTIQKSVQSLQLLPDDRRVHRHGCNYNEKRRGHVQTTQLIDIVARGSSCLKVLGCRVGFAMPAEPETCTKFSCMLRRSQSRRMGGPTTLSVDLGINPGLVAQACTAKQNYQIQVSSACSWNTGSAFKVAEVQGVVECE